MVAGVVGFNLLKVAGAGESEAARFGEHASLVEDEPDADLRRFLDESPFTEGVLLIWVMDGGG